MGRRACGLLLSALLLLAAALAPPAFGAGPPPLSGDQSLPDFSDTYGSGSFGSWAVDRFGLPMYRYTIDPATAPQAHQSELGGKTDAWHQLGNDYLVADAHNEGYIQLWSQARAYQWLNRFEPSAGHYAGGYGYLRVDGRTISTLYADRPGGASTPRDFGSGYFHRGTDSGPVAIDENVYAPFGDAPLLLHDVTIRNTSDRRLDANWVEYWDVNPYDEYRDVHLGLEAPRSSEGGRMLSVTEAPDSVDSNPLSVFAAALHGKVRSWETDGSAFFGSGGRANPAEVATGKLGGSLAPHVTEGDVGSTVFALESPVKLRPGESVTLRYGYGTAHADQISKIVAHWRGADSPFADSQRAWTAWLPRASFSGDNGWLSRELAWDGYMLRSGATYEEACGHHIVSQGGYYQYDFGWQAAFRDPLQHALPLIYADPELAREVLRYSAQEQDRASGEIPYSMGEMCRPLPQGTSDDLDLWLLWTAAEYGLASRDLSFFDEQATWRDGGSSSLWSHLERAFNHQESLRGPHGGYTTAGTNGDWSDLSPALIGMTESMLVTAQTAYFYPRLAELADARGETGFADQLRAAAARDRAVLRGQWTGLGWYSRGYHDDQQLGVGAIYGEPQPWGLLDGAPSTSQAQTLVANIRRFLTGVGAPPELHGPASIGSSQSPARNDPQVTERTFPGLSPNNALFPGGSWYSVNGWLVMGLAHAADAVPGAQAHAFDEFRRNTLAAHAHAYPDHWDGVLSVDDVCYAFYEADPSRCGIGFSTNYDTQIMHQPAWSLFDAIALAGLEPTGTGYRIDPKLPLSTFSLRLASVGIAYAPREARGYVRPQGHEPLEMAVTLPSGSGGEVDVFVDGKAVQARIAAGVAHFTLRADGGRAVDWGVVRS
jgi:Glycosyl hydrolase 36 superfamily, catalytic domain/Glycosyltransferase family 36